ncbi:MAG: TRAP transporter substrate-binding protein DctP [Bdellovibrionota bacterium]|nr:TRAP transporter substrate-binding protein DctP [Bdellovibrionota bacterium]
MKKMIQTLMAVVFLCASLSGHSKTVKLKIASMAPKGTSWGNALEAMAKEIKKATKKKVRLKLYLGGSAGDEPSVLRKINSGVMHGGVFTGRALGDVNGDVRVMEVPFTFLNNREKAWFTLQVMDKKLFNAGFESKGFKNLGFFEIGKVYLVSTEKVTKIAELKGKKIWSWSGDDISASLITSMKLVGVPLGLQDVLTSLSTGIIDTAYASPMGVLALQWQTKIKYLVNYPVTYSVGALLMRQKFWDKIPTDPKNPEKDYRTIVRAIIKKHVDVANKKMAQENIDALQAMKDQGIEFLNFPDDSIVEGRKIRQEVIDNLGGKLFSKEAVAYYNRVVKLPADINTVDGAISKIAADIEAEKKAAEEKAKKKN